MAVKLDLYRIFCEVAEEESISDAAKSLYISQSAVSQSIRQLEEQLQVRLFSRQPRGVTLTAEGRMLFDYVRNAIGLIETGEDKLQQTRKLMLGDLVIGASDTVTRNLLLYYLQQFHFMYPAIRIKILNGTSYEVLQMLRSGKVDLAFASTPQETENLWMRHCMTLHNVFVAAPDFPCEDRAYTLAELSRFPLMLLERKSSARRFLERFFSRNGVTLKPEIELCSHELLISVAAIGLGVACVTREFAVSALADGSIRELRTVPEIPERSLSVCALQEVTPCPAAERFLEFWA